MKAKRLVVFSVLATLCGQVQANLIINGSFEDGNFTGNASTSFNSLGVGSTAITGWVASRNGCDWHQAVEFAPAANGYRMVDLTHGTSLGGVKQSFATVIGGSYHVSFYMAGPKLSFQNPRVAHVAIAGNTYNFSTPASAEMSLAWEEKALDFIAIDTTSTLEFYGTGNGQHWGAVVDRVSVEAVPEFNSLVLLLPGVTTLFGLRKRSLNQRRR